MNDDHRHQNCPTCKCPPPPELVLTEDDTLRRAGIDGDMLRAAVKHGWLTPIRGPWHFAATEVDGLRAALRGERERPGRNVIPKTANRRSKQGKRNRRRPARNSTPEVGQPEERAALAHWTEHAKVPRQSEQLP